MEEKTLKALDGLKKALKEDPRLKKLDDLEKKLSSSPEVQALSRKKAEAEAAYNDCLSHFPVSSKEGKEKQKALYQAKLALDTHPLVKEYNAAFVAVRDLYMQIDDLLFRDFRHPSDCGADK